VPVIFGSKTILFAFLYFSYVVKKKISEELMSVKGEMKASSQDLNQLQWFFDHRSWFRRRKMLSFLLISVSMSSIVLGFSIFLGVPEYSSGIISETTNCSSDWITPYFVTIICFLVTNPPAIYIIWKWAPMPDNVHIRKSTILAMFFITSR
jgi:hypothetical protein